MTSDSTTPYHQTMPDYNREPQPEDQFGDVYVLVRKLGEGTMGQCWQAEEYTNKKRQGRFRHVVIKIVPPDVQNAEDEMKRVEDVFFATEKLHHPHICPVYALKQDENFGHYLVMRYIDGKTLEKYRQDLCQKGSITLSDALAVFKPLAEALDYAHRHQVIHRDIKPSNVMVENGVPYLIDFGLAAQIRESTTRLSQAVTNVSGTLAYMSPEQWKGEPQKTQTDQYALGVMFYDFLGGKLPFSSADRDVMHHLVTQEKMPPLEGFSETVNSALTKALAKERKERFESCVAFIQALEWGQKGIFSVYPDLKLPLTYLRLEDIVRAAQMGTVQDIGYFIDHKTNINAKVDGEWTLLYYAAHNPNVAVLQFLLDHGADVHTKDYLDRTPLYYAAENNPNVAVLQLLLDHGADVHIKDVFDQTPLHDAAANNSETAVLQCLLDHGADGNAKDNMGKVPLHYAARQNSNVTVLQILIDNGTDVCMKDDTGSMPLHYAAAYNSEFAVVKFLLDHGADVNAKDNEGRTPLHDAASFNSNVAVLRFLTDNGGDVGAKDNYGQSPLHCAVNSNSNVAVLLFLLVHGADVNAKDDKDRTPLHYMVIRHSNVDVLQLLLVYGADVHAKNNEGDTPLDCAVTTEQREILQKAMSQVNGN